MPRALVLAVSLLAGLLASVAAVAQTFTVSVPYTVTFSWSPVTAYASGAPLPGLPYYKLYVQNNAAPAFWNLIAWVPKGSTTYQVKLTAAGKYCYGLSDEIYDGTPNGNESPRSGPICVVAQ